MTAVASLHGRMDDGDPVTIVPASLVDEPVASGQLDQVRREDVQLWSFLTVLALHGGAHPVEVRANPDDPPDRFVSHGGVEWGLELTELTIGQVRGEFARARALGRQLRDALQASSSHDHLRGRNVVAAIVTPLQRRPDEVVPIVVDALREDRGCVGDDVPAGELPERFPPNPAGFYGERGGVVLQVTHRSEGPEEVTVAATVQSQIKRSEALAALAARVADKDDPRNDALLITCGAPDEWGSRCPLDAFVFQALAEAVQAGVPLLERPPEHLKSVVMHLWGSAVIVEVFEGHRPPWFAPLEAS